MRAMPLVNRTLLTVPIVDLPCAQSRLPRTAPTASALARAISALVALALPPLPALPALPALSLFSLFSLLSLLSLLFLFSLLSLLFPSSLLPSSPPSPPVPLPPHLPYDPRKRTPRRHVLTTMMQSRCDAMPPVSACHAPTASPSTSNARSPRPRERGLAPLAQKPRTRTGEDGSAPS